MASVSRPTERPIMTNPTPHGQVPDAHNTTAIPGAAAEQLFIPAGWNKAGGSNPPLYTAAQVAALTAAPGVQSLSDGQIASACMSYRHDFGLLEPDERAKIMFTAREWERAFSKEREWTAPAQPAPAGAGALPAGYQASSLVCGAEGCDVALHFDLTAPADVEQWLSAITSPTAPATHQP